MTIQFEEINQLFKGYVICLSGYTSEEREMLGKMIELYGGIYTEDMDSRTVSFLLSKGLLSDKAKHAKKWGVPVLKHQWLFDCIVERRFLSINNYIFQPSN